MNTKSVQPRDGAATCLQRSDASELEYSPTTPLNGYESSILTNERCKSHIPPTPAGFDVVTDQSVKAQDIKVVSKNIKFHQSDTGRACIDVSINSSPIQDDLDGSGKPVCDSMIECDESRTLDLNYKWRGEADISSPNHLILELFCGMPSQDQLIVERDSIYSGFIMIENKAIEVMLHLKSTMEAVHGGPGSPRSVKEDLGTTITANESPPGTASGAVSGTFHVQEPVDATDDGIEENNSEGHLSHLDDPRMLEKEETYKKIGDQYFMLVGSMWLKSLAPEQYKALNDLHKVLVSEHFDLTLVSLHPCSSSSIMNFATDNKMDERVWQRCIYSYLDFLCSRLPESSEHLDSFIYDIYGILTSLEEMRGSDQRVWIEAQAALAQYKMKVASWPEDRQHWKRISKRQYIRASDMDTTADIVRQQFVNMQSTQYAFQFFHHIKSLVVRTPSSATRESIISAMMEFVTPENHDIRQKGSLSFDQRSLFVAVARLVLASLEPSRLIHLIEFENVFRDILRCYDEESNMLGGNEHNSVTIPRAVLYDTETSCSDRRIDNIVCSSYEPDKTSDQYQARNLSINQLEGSSSIKHTLQPSPELGLLLCQLLLGIPVHSGRTDTSTDESTPTWDENLAIISITDEAARLLSFVMKKVLSKPNTTDLKLWEFLHILLVFMHRVQHHPQWSERLKDAFHPELMAPLLNVLLRQAQIKGGDDWNQIFQQDFIIMTSPLNKLEEPGMMGSNDSYNHHEDAIGSNIRNTNAGTENIEHEGSFMRAVEKQFTCPLPEDYQMRGFPFMSYELAPFQQCASGVEIETSTEDAGPNTELSESHHPAKLCPRVLRSPINPNVKGLIHHERPFFPVKWFEESKYDDEERRVRQDYVQDVKTVRYRERRILWLLIRLIASGPLYRQQSVSQKVTGGFFSSHQDHHGNYYVGDYRVSAIPGPHLDSKLPEVVRRDGGIEVVYVHPAIHRRVAKVDAAWQQRVECEETGNVLTSGIPRSDIDMNWPHIDDDLELTYPAKLADPCITSAWEFEKEHKSRGSDTDPMLHHEGTCQREATVKTTKADALLENSRTQLSPMGDATASGLGHVGNGRAWEYGIQDDNSEEWTVIGAASTVGTDRNGWEEGWFSHRFGQYR